MSVSELIEIIGQKEMIIEQKETIIEQQETIIGQKETIIERLQKKGEDTTAFRNALDKSVSESAKADKLAASTPFNSKKPLTTSSQVPPYNMPMFFSLWNTYYGECVKTKASEVRMLRLSARLRTIWEDPSVSFQTMMKLENACTAVLFSVFTSFLGSKSSLYPLPRLPQSDSVNDSGTPKWMAAFVFRLPVVELVFYWNQR